MNGTAVFELFVRKLPAQRNFLLAAGLAQVVDYLTGLRFTAEELDWLAQTRPLHAPRSSSRSRDLRFTGDVDAHARRHACSLPTSRSCASSRRCARRSSSRAA